MIASVRRPPAQRPFAAATTRVRSSLRRCAAHPPSSQDPNLFGQADDEEPDRFGHYGYDIAPERHKQIVKSFNAVYYIQRGTMIAETLKHLMMDKWGQVYSVQLCLAERQNPHPHPPPHTHQQVYLQIDPTPTRPENALDPLLAATAATLTEWGVADATYRIVAKHPDKRMPRDGLLIPLPVHFCDPPS